MAADVSEFKQRVNQHIDVIRRALTKAVEQGNPEHEIERLTERLKSMEEEVEATQRQLVQQKHKALTDSLTGLLISAAYNAQVSNEFQLWQRYQRPLTMAVCDIDKFKRINDEFGHQAGDRVIKVLARGLRKRLREVDFIARYGGEEFVILLPQTGLEQAHDVLDEIRAEIAKTPFRFKDNPLGHYFDWGAQFQEGDTVEKVFARADKLLYTAKEQGRNRCLT